MKFAIRSRNITSDISTNEFVLISDLWQSSQNQQKTLDVKIGVKLNKFLTAL